MALCGACGKECHVVAIDYGFGLTEAYGVCRQHHDWHYVSDCCESEHIYRYEDYDEETGRPFLCGLLTLEDRRWEAINQ